MIYQIKRGNQDVNLINKNKTNVCYLQRGKQDINLINDENPKKGYKFVLFVGENGSGKTNF